MHRQGATRSLPLLQHPRGIKAGYPDFSALRRRMACEQAVADAGRPLKIAWQEEVSNRQRVGPKAPVVSVAGKGLARRDRVRVRELNACEPLTRCRKDSDVIKTGVSELSRDERGGNPSTGPSVTGMKAQDPNAGSRRERRNLGGDAKGKVERRPRDAEKYPPKSLAESYREMYGLLLVIDFSPFWRPNCVRRHDSHGGIAVVCVG